MRAFVRQLRPALLVFVALTAICGVVYPLVVTAIGQTAFHYRANGSLVRRNGALVGSELLGQTFTAPGYFHGRPSALTDTPIAQVSGASNLGPTSDELAAAVRQRVTAYRAENGLPATQLVPVDAVTASGSGLDPHISVANARLQAGRVATARGLPVDQVMALIAHHVDGRMLGVLGEPGVNVLRLNLALDALRSNQ